MMMMITMMVRHNFEGFFIFGAFAGHQSFRALRPRATKPLAFFSLLGLSSSSDSDSLADDITTVFAADAFFFAAVFFFGAAFFLGAAFFFLGVTFLGAHLQIFLQRLPVLRVPWMRLSTWWGPFPPLAQDS